MRLPESWLREFCDPPIGTRELADRLTMGGLEVESIDAVAPPFAGVVVGHVRSVEPHPNADRLRVCAVDVGEGATLTVVCGAPNVRAGMKAPLARVGATLPPDASRPQEPVRIAAGRIRGVESQGMLCSARELGLSDDHQGLLALADDAPTGTDVREWLALDDSVLTLKLTPNLGHALSVHGVARELAAITGTPLVSPRIDEAAVGDDSRLRVTIDAPELCGRFSGRVIRGVDPTARSPAWLVDRLARCGQRSVSALVDISNYVMFELGRPSHIFDLDKIEGGLVVRWGRPGEQVELLNGETIEVDEQVGVIADDVRVESLAGIMGGEATAVSDSTRNIYVEAAFWWPEAIAGRPRRFQLSTDAGHRFERGVDPSTTVEHIERITALIVEICGGSAVRCGPIDDQVTGLPARGPVALRVARAAKVIGMPVTQADCERVLARLGFEQRSRDGVIEVVPPPWRFDLTIEEDLIEEVIRLIGYDALPAGPARGTLVAHVASESRRGASRLRHLLADLGWQETIGFSFVDAGLERDLAGNADPLRVVNPIAENASVMRSSLLVNLIDALRVNLARRQPRVRLFELGKVFVRDAAAEAGPHAVGGLRQPLRLGGLAAGPALPLQWAEAERPVDFYDVKGDVEALLAPARATFAPAAHPALHPGRSATVMVDGRPIGFVGELHPRWRQALELPAHVVVFELDAEALTSRPLPSFTTPARQQSVLRDLAIVVARDVRHDDVIAAVTAAGEKVVREAVLFDVYRPKGAGGGIAEDEQSLAIRLELRDDARTLTDEAIDQAVAGVVESLRARVGARLRQQ